MFTQVRYNDLILYENCTDPDGPAMTHSMFAIGWLDLGEKQKAEKPFLKNYANIRGPFKVRSVFDLLKWSGVWLFFHLSLIVTVENFSNAFN